jgi:hypothetical protein
MSITGIGGAFTVTKRPKRPWTLGTGKVSLRAGIDTPLLDVDAQTAIPRKNM